MDREYIQTIFPEIAKIKSAELRKGVMDAWLLAAKKGGWQKIDDIPFTLLTSTTKTIVEHTRIVTDMAIAIGQTRDDIDLDILIASGIVHDVGKLLEYAREGNSIVKSPLGKLIRHPISGYGIALAVGLPLEVAHVIAAHSKEGESVVRSKEAIIIHHCDFIDFDITRSA